MLRSPTEFKREDTLKKERAFPCTSFRKKKLLNFKRESTYWHLFPFVPFFGMSASPMMLDRRIHPDNGTCAPPANRKVDRAGSSAEALRIGEASGRLAS